MPIGVVTGDFNGDGKVDIAAVEGVANAVGSVGVLFGNGDGTFAPSVVTSVGVNSPGGMVAADFNGDGKLDLVLGGQRLSDHTNQTYLLVGKGDGTFQAPSIIAPGAGVTGVADLNGDGKLDIVIWSTPIVEVLLGNGNGTFQQKAAFPTATNGTGFPLAIADFNGDGKLDISDGSSATFGKGNGTFQDVNASTVNIPQGVEELTKVVSGDFNGDGKSDLAVSMDGPTPSIYILLGDGTGKYTVSNVYNVSAVPTDLQTGDFNGDHKMDLVFSTQNSDSTVSAQVMLGHGDGSFGTPVASLLGPGFVGSPGAPIGVADFNGDGLDDVAAIENGELAVLIGAGDGTFESPVSYFVGTTPLSFGLGDFNGDGKVDAAVCSVAGFGVLRGKGDGTLNNVTLPSMSPSPCQVAAVADFNNDGLSDVLLPGEMLLSNGDGTFTPAATGTPSGKATMAADVNGDGKLDLITSDGLLAFPGNGDGTFPNVAIQTVSFLPPWINPLIWANQNDENNLVTSRTVFAVVDFGGGGLPGIAMIVQSPPGGEISLPNPLPAPAAEFFLSATTPGLLAPGGQTALTVKSKPIGGFNTDIALSCDGLPAGLTCSFTPATITGGAGTATVTIAASSSATMGTYPITLTGTAGGSSHSQTRAITIASSQGATNAHLGPVAINFAAQPVASSGAAVQTATLTNAGTAILQVSGVSIAGSNAADFSIANNGCGTSVAAGASCQISVMFSPQASGARSGMLTVTDNATGGTQVVNLSGSGADFAVGPAPGGGSTTVAAGKTASYSLTIGGNSGFIGSVSLSCSGAPTAATCEVSPATVRVNNASGATATVTVTTTARSVTVSRDEGSRPGIYGTLRVVVVALYSFGLALSIGLMLIAGSRQRRRISWAQVAAGVLLLVGLAISGCGGGSAGGTAMPPPSGGTATGTPAGSYTITVTATAGSGASAVSHTTNLTLVVQ